LKPRWDARIKAFDRPRTRWRMELPEPRGLAFGRRDRWSAVPLDSPWPSRLRRCLAPGRGFKSCNLILVGFGTGLIEN